MKYTFLHRPARLIQITAVVVAGSVVLALAHLAWSLMGLSDPDLRPVEPNSPLGPPADTSALGSSLALAPFGRAADPRDLPATLLPLVLKGVVYSPDPATSFALISTGGGPGQTWGVGQAPVEGAVIEAIEIDRVVLGVSGRREALSFPSLSSSGASPTASPASGSVQSPADPQSGTGATSAGSGQASAGADETAQAAPAGPPARTQGQPATPGPGAMLSAAGLSTTTDGLRVGPDPSARLRRAGLQPGDLILTLNGRPVADVASERQLIERAILAGSARVEVERDGVNLTLTIPLR